jgi:hypothetical protein
MGLDTKTHWLTDRQSQCDFDFDFEWLTDRQSQCDFDFDLKLSSKRPEYSGKLEEYSKQAVSLRSTEEYKKSACEDLTCELKILCVL